MLFKNYPFCHLVSNLVSSRGSSRDVKIVLSRVASGSLVSFLKFRRLSSAPCEAPSTHNTADSGPGVILGQNSLELGHQHTKGKGCLEDPSLQLHTLSERMTKDHQPPVSPST